MYSQLQLLNPLLVSYTLVSDLNSEETNPPTQPELNPSEFPSIKKEQTTIEVDHIDSPSPSLQITST